MTTRVVRMPLYPECWSSCGSCASGEVFILEILVEPGQWLERDENILTLETGKVALDIPTPCAGRVREIYVTVGDHPQEQAPLLLLDVDG